MLSRLQRTLREYRRLDRRVWWLALIRAVNTGGLSLVLIYMGIYLVTQRGLSMTAYAAIALAANVGQSYAQGFAGMLSDRIGRRPVMGSALALRSVVLVILGLLVRGDAPIWAFVIALLISSSLRGVFEPVAYALVADVVEAKDRVVAFGLQRMGTNLGWAIGPAAGGALVVSMSYGAVFFCAAPVLLIAAYLSFRVREPPRTRPTGEQTSVIGALRQALSSRDAAIFLAGAFLFAVCHMQLFHTLAIYGTATLGLTEAQIGKGYFVNAIFVLALQLPAVGMIDRIGTRAAMIAGSVLYIAAFLIVGHVAALLGVFLAIAVLTTGEVLLSPAQQAVVAELSDPDKYGRAFGVIGTVQMLGVAVGPLLGAIPFDLYGHDGVAMWSTLAVLPLLMLVAFVWFARRIRVLS